MWEKNTFFFLSMLNYYTLNLLNLEIYTTKFEIKDIYARELNWESKRKKFRIKILFSFFKKY